MQIQSYINCLQLYQIGQPSEAIIKLQSNLPYEYSENINQFVAELQNSSGRNQLDVIARLSSFAKQIFRINTL